jgi:DMSO/TMAO reductase YedYZ heme-binding membrane subunit
MSYSVRTAARSSALSLEQALVRVVRWIIVPCALIYLGLEVRLTFKLDFFETEAVWICLGRWSTRFLLLTIAIGPLSRLLNRGWLRQCRRPLGLLAFTFALAHAGVYFFDLGGNATVLHWILTRLYLIAGLLSLLLVGALALTSSNFAMRHLGAPVWRRIHVCVICAALPRGDGVDALREDQGSLTPEA